MRVLAAFALVVSGCSNDKQAASETGAASTFRVVGSIGQASAVDLKPSTKAELLEGSGTVLRSATSDRLGSVMFYDVKPGSGYSIRGTGASGSVGTAPVTVLSRNDTPLSAQYTKQTFKQGLNYIRMRDGVELAMTVRLPQGKTLEDGPFPTVIEYSGYDVAPPHDLLADMTRHLTDPSAPSDPLAPSGSTAVGGLIAPILGFATVSVQIRGSGCSGGAFDLFGLPSIYDGYDAIESVGVQPWVAHHKVGMVGISYSGYSQLFIGGTRPPHLGALAPMSVTEDLFTGIGFPGGIQNTGFAKGWITERQHDAQPAPEGGQTWARELVKQGDQHCIDNQKLHGQAKDGVSIINSLEFRDPKLFKDRTPASWAAKINVPTFLVGGLQDEQLDSHWTEAIAAMSKGNKDLWVTMYNGNHNDALAPQIMTRWIEFLDLFIAHKVPDVPAALVGIANVIASQASNAAAPPLLQSTLSTEPTVDAAMAKFRQYPKVHVMLDVGAGPLGPGSLQPMYEHDFDAWPPREVSATTWHLADNGGLQSSTPTSADGPSAADSYVSDPSARPGTSEGHDEGHHKKHFRDEPNQWLPLVNGKGLGYTTAPLSADVMIAGTSSLDAYVTATKPDTDLQVTLSEVRPDGQEMYVQTGWLRASHRKLDTATSTATDPRPTHLQQDAAPLPAGAPTLVRVQVFPVVHTFRAGSRIRVSISAAGGDRPIWTFRTIDDGSTTVTVARSSKHPSALVLPVVTGGRAGAPLPPCGTLRGQECRTFIASSTGG